MAKTKKKKSSQPHEYIELERQYEEIFRIAHEQQVRQRRMYRDNLAQPSTLRTVETVTTYGAYQNPI